MAEGIQKDQFYSELIKIVNDYERTRDQNIENKNVSIINFAGIFLTAATFIVSFFLNRYEIHEILFFSIIINLFCFLIPIIIGLYSIGLKQYESYNVEKFILTDKDSIAKKIRDFNEIGLSILKKFEININSKIRIFRINYKLIFCCIISFVIQVFLVLLVSSPILDPTLIYICLAIN